MVGLWPTINRKARLGGQIQLIGGRGYYREDVSEEKIGKGCDPNQFERLVGIWMKGRVKRPFEFP